MNARTHTPTPTPSHHTHTHTHPHPHPHTHLQSSFCDRPFFLAFSRIDYSFTHNLYFILLNNIVVGAQLSPSLSAHSISTVWYFFSNLRPPNWPTFEKRVQYMDSHCFTTVFIGTAVTLFSDINNALWKGVLINAHSSTCTERTTNDYCLYNT